jgi:hypothetical protein
MRWRSLVFALPFGKKWLLFIAFTVNIEDIREQYVQLPMNHLNEAPCSPAEGISASLQQGILAKANNRLRKTIGYKTPIQVFSPTFIRQTV